MTGEACCFNCGLSGGAVHARIKFRAENSYHRPSARTLAFCSEECAVQFMFLQLETRSTRELITRYFAGKPITLAQFRRLVPVEGSDRAEMGSQVADSNGAKNGKNGNPGLPHMPPISARKSSPGRPKKWKSNAERMRAYRRAEECR
jgi:hypothetical protein